MRLDFFKAGYTIVPLSGRRTYSMVGIISAMILVQQR